MVTFIAFVFIGTNFRRSQAWVGALDPTNPKLLNTLWQMTKQVAAGEEWARSTRVPTILRSNSFRADTGRKIGHPEKTESIRAKINTDSRFPVKLWSWPASSRLVLVTWLYPFLSWT